MTDRFRALALDLDGTLLDPQGALAPAVVTAIQQAAAAGVRVYLVSGRMQPSIVPFWQTLALTTPIISYNGAQIAVPGKKPLFSAVLPAAAAVQIIAYCREHDYSLNTYFADRLYTLRDDEFSRWYAGYFRVPRQILPASGELPGEGPSKMLITLPDQNAVDAVFPEVQAAFAAAAGLTTSSGRFIEFLPCGVNKGTSVARLAAAEGIPLTAWVAAGDGMNDYEMLSVCGAGLRVENCAAALRPLVPRSVPALYAGGIRRLLREFFGVDL